MLRKRQNRKSNSFGSKREFSNSARRVHKANLTPNNARGGFRL